MALGALALAAALGFSLGRGVPQGSLETAWAQRYYKDPVAAGKVLIDGVELRGVVGVGGLESYCTVEEFVDPQTGEVRKLPADFGVKNVELSLAAHKVEDDVLGRWFQTSIVEGRLEKKAGAVVIYNRETGEDLLRYQLEGAWPCKWYVPELDSDSSGMAIEKIEIAVEKVERG